MADIDDELKRRFPKMAPMKGSPAMFTINGIGTSLYGKRDYDAETESYVATLCVVVLFIPVLCLKSYRVVKAQAGWYFIGKEPLSVVAKSFNLLILALIATGVVLIQHNIRTSSPEYLAEQRMNGALKQIEAGQLADAARTCQEVFSGHTSQWDNARAAMDDIVDNRCQTCPLSESAKVYNTAVGLSRSGKWKSPTEVAEKGLKLVSARGTSDPQSGVALLDLVRPLVLDTRPVDDLSLPLLRQWVAAEPKNLDAVVPLAAMLDEQKKPDEAKALLMPVRDSLGQTEGARVLGSILADEGDYDAAYALLQPYVEGRLARLREAEANFDSTLDSLQDRELEALQNDEGPASFYNRYQAATEEKKNTILQEYIYGRIKDDPEYAAAQKALAEASSVVPVALDLGIVMLRRAQDTQDAAARKSQLEAAEKVFLAIGGVAGESDTYRVTLGQVQYWLGKYDEGRRLFDEFLATKERSPDALLIISSRYRDLGAESDARALSEEAYKKSSTNPERYAAAILRALTHTDTEDQIDWLKKSDPNSPVVKAELANAEGDKAVSDGRDAEAVEQYKTAIAAYSAMPRSSSTLNQAAVAHFSVYRLTGDAGHWQSAVDNFRQALELEPADPILRYNAGSMLLDGSMTEIASKAIDLKLLKTTGNTLVLSGLYNDAAGRSAIQKAVADHPGMNRGVSYMDQVVVLSPNNLKAYAYLAAVHRFTRDSAAMERLRTRFVGSGVDTSDQLDELKAHLSGDNDEQDLISYRAVIDRLEASVKTVRPVGGPTAATAISRLSSSLLANRSYGVKVDADRVVALADEAWKLSPSLMTDSDRCNAYLARVAEQLAAADKAFAAHLQAHQRAVPISYLVVVAATEQGPFRQKISAHPDFVRAVELTRQKVARMADASAFDWALLSAVDGGEAGQAADLIRKDDRRQRENDLDLLLQPFSVADAIDGYWLDKIYRTNGGGQAALKRLAAEGVPMPVPLK